MSYIEELAKKIGLKFPLEQDDQTISIAGFHAFALTSEQVKISNVVPTTTLEDGSTIGDDIIPNPTELTISGMVTDKFYLVKRAPHLIGKDFSKVGDLTGLLRNRDQATLQKMSQIDDMIASGVQFGERIERGVRNAVSFAGVENETVNSFLNPINDYLGIEGAKKPDENIKNFLVHLDTLQNFRQPIEIITSRKTWKNMAIQSVTLGSKPNESSAIEFNMNLVQINTAALQYTEIMASAVAKQHEGIQDNGTQVMMAGSAKDVPVSFASYLSGKIFE